MKTETKPSPNSRCKDLSTATTEDKRGDHLQTGHQVVSQFTSQEPFNHLSHWKAGVLASCSQSGHQPTLQRPFDQLSRTNASDLTTCSSQRARSLSASDLPHGKRHVNAIRVHLFRIWEKENPVILFYSFGGLVEYISTRLVRLLIKL